MPALIPCDCGTLVKSMTFLVLDHRYAAFGKLPSTPAPARTAMTAPMHNSPSMILKTWLSIPGRRPVIFERLRRDERDDDAADDGDRAFELGASMCMSLPLDEIEDREQHNPDDVDEVPVQRACGRGRRTCPSCRRRGSIARSRIDEVEHADEDVESVHPGEREERGAEDAAARPRDVLVEDQVVYS